MTDWKHKLAAYLHDPPSKCLDIRTHGDRSDAAFRQAGITDEAEVGDRFAPKGYLRFSPTFDLCRHRMTSTGGAN